MPSGGTSTTAAHSNSGGPTKTNLQSSRVFKETAFSLLKAGLTVTLAYYFIRTFLYPRIYNEDLVERSTMNRLIFVIGGISILHTILYYLVNGINLYMQHNRIWSSRMIERRENLALPRSDLVRNALKDFFWDQLLQGALLVACVPFLFSRGIFMTDPSMMPSMVRVFLESVLCEAFLDTAFYFIHRLLHTKALYARVHKKHHLFYASTAFAAEYAHPLEQLVANFFPTFFLCIILKFHYVTLLAWLFYRLLETFEAHSQYRIFFNGTGLHDFHHSQNIGNFGISPFWDWFCGTASPTWVAYWKKVDS